MSVMERTASLMPLGIIAALLLIPLAAGAQDDTRAQIRADLQQDPRTAQMSAEELDRLVEALAGEVESTEEGAVYLDAQSAPTFVYDAPPVTAASPWVSVLSSPIVIALLALLVGILGLVVFALRHRKAPPTDPNTGII